MTKFEKLITILVMIYIVAILSNIFVLKRHMDAMREIERAVREAGDRPVEIHYKQIE